MPLIDANAQLTARAWAGHDVVVVGAGAAGIFLASRLTDLGKRVLLIESGGLESDDEHQGLNEMEQVGKPFSAPLWNRRRTLGGTTTAWGGQSRPFPREEFSARDWVDHSGWPISFDDLAAHYPIANAFMQIDDLSDEILNRIFRLDPGFDPDVLHHHYSKWAAQPNLFKLHRQDLARRVEVLFNAQLLRIDLGEADRTRRIVVGNFNGETAEIAIDGDLVLTPGGIESVRLLLLNDHQHSGGLGARGGWLGKGFMDHPCIEAGVVQTDDMLGLQSTLGTRVRLGRRYSSRVGSSATWQARRRMLSVCSGLMWLYEDGDIGPLAQLRAFTRKPTPEALGRAFSDLGRLAPGLWALAAKRVVYKPGVTARFVLCGEQEPDRGSTISLGERRDRFGQRLARLDWRIGEKTWRSMIAYAEDFGAELQRTGLGRLALFEHIHAEAPDWHDRLSDVNHHMGGCRMSASVDEGVVDPNLRVWGADNLFVCSGAVFPTGFHSNPTLTVMALASRLADHLATVGR